MTRVFLLCLLIIGASALVTSAFAEPAPAASYAAATCEGTYPLHLQGVATDGAAIYWSWTEALVKTDLQGKLLLKVAADNHHGDPCAAGGRVYVAVNLGKFNEPEGTAKSWVYVYDAQTLALTGKHPVPEVVHGAGGIAERQGHFYVVGGLPPDVSENYAYEYDAEFRFQRRHIIASGHTDKGIQTATWDGHAWWFGCYGKPQELLRTDAEFRVTRKWKTAAALGLEALPGGRFLIGRDMAKEKQHTGSVVILRADDERGLAPEE